MAFPMASIITGQLMGQIQLRQSPCFGQNLQCFTQQSHIIATLLASLHSLFELPCCFNRVHQIPKSSNNSSTEAYVVTFPSFSSSMALANVPLRERVDFVMCFSITSTPLEFRNSASNEAANGLSELNLKVIVSIFYFCFPTANIHIFQKTSLNRKKIRSKCQRYKGLSLNLRSEKEDCL